MEGLVRVAKARVTVVLGWEVVEVREREEGTLQARDEMGTLIFISFWNVLWIFRHIS